MSEGKEFGHARTMDAAIKKNVAEYESKELAAYVSAVGNRVAKTSDRPGIIWHFTVLDSPAPDAFTTFGTYIYITRGLLAHLGSESELAAVLAHEIGHAVSRHGARRASQQNTTGVALLATMIANPAFLLAPGLITKPAAAGMNTISRTYELEADRLGVEYLRRAGYDPAAMARVLSALQQQETYETARAKEENRPPLVYHGVFATHPTLEKRTDAVVSHGNSGVSVAESDNRAGFLAAIEGMQFGARDKEGALRNGMFFHRDRGLAIPVPKGWFVRAEPWTLNLYSPDPRGRIDIAISSSKIEQNGASYLRFTVGDSGLRDEQPLVGAAGYSIQAGIADLGPDDRNFLQFFANTKEQKLPARVVAFVAGEQRILFHCVASDRKAFVAFDPLCLDVARGLRPITEADKALLEPQRISLYTARSGDTFAALARQSPLGDKAEPTLRLLNSRYPSGEPQAGETLKLVR